MGCGEAPTQNSWNLNTGEENQEPVEFLRYGNPDKEEDISTPPPMDTWEPPLIEEDIGEYIPIPDVVDEDLTSSPDVVIEEDTAWTPPTTVCVGITLSPPVESCPTPPPPEEEELEEETTEDVVEDTSEEDADAGSLSYSLFADDAGATEEEEIDPCDYKPNTCPGATLPDWNLCDFQPQSCGYEAQYPLSKFKGHVTVVALFASW